MGILDSVSQGRLPKLPLIDSIIGGIFRRRVGPPFDYGPDFPDGLQIIELVNGREQEADMIILAGVFLPMQPFEFGGEQRVVKDYYPGNSEPVVQVLGARESDMTIKGRLKSKRFKDVDLRLVSREYQELIDAMRIRGNLVKITLGEWRRYGFIERTTFRMNRLTDIEYEIGFSIVGFNAPTNCKFLENPDDDLIRPNKELILRAKEELLEWKNYPDEMPRSLSEFLDDVIGTVAGVVALVTNFVDGVLTEAENVQASANRAIGLIKHARTTIYKSQRRIGQLKYGFDNLGNSASGAVAGLKTTARYSSTNHLLKILAGMSALAVLLRALQLKYAALAKTIPMRRHRVIEGDNLQKLAVKYYNNQDLWNKIYDHNQLTSTVLVRGAILEIPRE
jgi:hypothetical protein